uniref:Uncharacterized protein n=1 Tax=Anguilla anguilla TaxID=7936 RepID=A0A0E9PQW5_ANGAN
MIVIQTPQLCKIKK